MHTDRVASLLSKHPRLSFEARHLDCGPGWMALIEELLSEIDELLTDEMARTVQANGLEAVHGRLDVQLTWDATNPRLEVIEEMVAAIWRRSEFVCELCGAPARNGLCVVCRETRSATGLDT